MSSKKREHAQPNEISQPKRKTKAETLIAEIKAKHAQQAPVKVNTTKKPKKEPKEEPVAQPVNVKPVRKNHMEKGSEASKQWYEKMQAAKLAKKEREKETQNIQ
jgi:hypothetical protein